MFYVYLLRLKDNRLYVGYTRDIQKRFKLHNQGKGAYLTNQLGVRSLLYKETFQTVEEAKKREHQLKGWSREKKYALISGDLDCLKQLAKKPRTSN